MSDAKDSEIRLRVFGRTDVGQVREHNEDIPELLSYYVDYFADRESLPYRQFSMAAQNRLRNYSWHGNIRELKNLVQRLLILGAGEDVSLEEVEAALSVRAVSAATEPGTGRLNGVAAARSA